MKLFRPVIFLVIILLLLSSATGFHIALARQSQFVWSPYERVPGYADSTYPPILVADQNRTVHSFAAQMVGDEEKKMAVLYRKWSLVNQWSAPVDILLAPERLVVDGAYIDGKGIIHLIFWQSGLSSRGLYYSAAPVLTAEKAVAWSKPKLISTDAVEPSFGVIFGDQDSKLVVVYNGNLDGSGVYVVQSEDGGKNWSRPTSVFQTADPKQMPVYFEANAGSFGKYHLVWNVVDDKGKDVSVYYTQYDFTTDTWSKPVSIGDSSTQPAGFGTAFPVVFEQNGVIYTVYNDGIPPLDVPPALYMKISTDGLNWLGPSRIFPEHVGRSGEHSGASDSRGIYHLLFVQRIPLEVNGVYKPIGGIWHSEYDGKRWSAPEQVTIKGSKENYAWHDVNVVVSQGNVVLAVWRVDPGFEGKGVWYSYLVLDAPETPVVSYEMPVESLPTPVEPTRPVAGTEEKSASDVRIEQEIQPIAMDNIIERTILSGLIPVFLLFVVFLGYYNWRQLKKT